MINMDVLKIQEANTRVIGKQICYREEFESTHLKSKQIVKKLSLIDNGSILLADRQSNGVGTHGREWYTGTEENIAMTIILIPKCEIGELENLTIIIAQSMQKAIKELYGYTIIILLLSSKSLILKVFSDIFKEILMIFLYPNSFIAYSKNIVSKYLTSIPIIGLILYFLHSK